MKSSTNQSTFAKFWNLETFLIRFGTVRLKWKTGFMEIFFHRSAPKFSYQSAFVPSKRLSVENWTLKSRTLTSPRSLDQCGGPWGSTGVELDGTVHDTGLSIIPTNANPPPSVCTSHQIYFAQGNDNLNSSLQTNYCAAYVNYISFLMACYITGCIQPELSG
jgi:hypothetical protein